VNIYTDSYSSLPFLMIVSEGISETLFVPLHGNGGSETDPGRERAGSLGGGERDTEEP
jgi:hypothetical protein